MGKPKALRKRDVVPTISTVEKTSTSHITFDDDNEDTRIVIEPTVSEELAKDESAQNEEHGNEQPDEVTSSSVEVVLMKQMHERMMDSFTKKKKRKVKELSTNTAINSDANFELDASVLEIDEDGSQKSLDEQEEVIVPNARTELRIDKKKTNSKKIGNIEVAMLEVEQYKDPISVFSVPPDVSRFVKAANQKNSRVDFAAFAAKKKGGPSKKFSKP